MRGELETSDMNWLNDQVFFASHLLSEIVTDLYKVRIG